MSCHVGWQITSFFLFDFFLFLNILRVCLWSSDVPLCVFFYGGSKLGRGCFSLVAQYTIIRILKTEKLVRLCSDPPISPYKLSVFYKSDHPLITSVHGSWGNGPQVAMTTG